ncbi:MAG: DMT family transporter [Pseudomonadales bacterium]|nr:DMT family transporter [Pseudomonadales bacterium]
MPVFLAYIAVIVVWSTTPLGVKWSGEGLSPVFGAFARMALAATAAWLLAKLLKVVVPWHRKAVRSYLFANIGWTLGMICVYFSAAILPSGLISVLFGLSPIITALLAQYLIPDSELSLLQWGAVLMGVFGLGVVFQGDLVANSAEYWAIGLSLIGVLCFCLSGVLIKREDAGLHPLSQTTGSLTFAVPIYALMALVLGDGAMSPTNKALGAIVYLGIVGSVVGFLCYFYILKKLSPTTVALSPLITPIFAVILGAWLNNEIITHSLVIGAGCIIFGLLLFQIPYKPARAFLQK